MELVLVSRGRDYDRYSNLVLSQIAYIIRNPYLS
jgi:hypothetical protein